MAERMEDGCVPGNCSYRPEQNSPEWYRIQRNRQALAEEAKGNLVFRDDAGNAISVLDTSNL
jgi:hypothetical protein